MLCGPYWVGWMYGLSGSVCQEGGRVVWGEGLGAEGDEMGVVGGEGVDGFGGGEGLLAEGCGFAARCGVEDEDAVGEVGDAGVAAGGGGGGGAAGAVGKGGEQQEAAGGEGVAPGAGECAWRRGRGLDNVFCERLWRSVKYENIYLNQYDSVRRLQAGFGAYFDFYNHERPHQSLNYRTPTEEHFVL